MKTRHPMTPPCIPQGLPGSFETLHFRGWFCVFVCMFVCVFVCVFMRVRGTAHVHMCGYMYLYIYIYVCVYRYSVRVCVGVFKDISIHKSSAHRA